MALKSIKPQAEPLMEKADRDVRTPEEVAPVVPLNSGLESPPENRPLEARLAEAAGLKESETDDPYVEARQEIHKHYDEFTRILEERRREAEQRQMKERSLLDRQLMGSPETGDVGDASIMDENTDYYLVLADRQRRELLQIQAALDRIRRGVFGVCENCETEIPLKRLRRLPTARFCVDCQDSFEKGQNVAKVHPFPKI